MLEDQGIALAEEFGGFGGGDSGVRRQAIKMVEARARGVWWEGEFAELNETFLEAVVGLAGVGITGGDGAAGAGIAPFKVYGADAEADYVALVFGEESIFPEGGGAIDFEGSAEAEAGFFEGEAGKPIANGLQSRGGNDGRAVGDGVVGKAVRGIADDDLLIEENAKPFGGVFVSLREVEGARGNAAPIVGDGEGDGA